MKEAQVDEFLNSVGFGFPENSEQLKEFDRIYSDYTFKAKVTSIDAAKILACLRKEETPITNIDYHKRTVLAAEIVWQLQREWSLGHVKLQKMMYLCQNTITSFVHANFLKQALGPYDPKLMRSLDKQFKDHKWFEFKKDGLPKYCLLENAGEHKTWFDRYYIDYTHQIQFIIDTFRQTKTDDIELIATIYACWLEITQNGETFTETLLIERVYAWSPNKQKFSEKNILSSVAWMLEKGIYPKLNGISL